MISHIGLYSEELIKIVDDAFVMPGLFVERTAKILSAIDAILSQAPFRYMTTPGGSRMSVAMTNCGSLGWVTDRQGYRYSKLDPETNLPWPAMPPLFLEIAQVAATKAGFKWFVPDACLINQYQAGARMALHRDKDEQDATAPIVSISLGLNATFMFGGAQRSDRPQRIILEHGDAVVWGGTARFNFHGISSLNAGFHPIVGPQRINLTFRKVLGDE